MIRYKVHIDNPLSGFVHIQTLFSATGNETIYLQLPAWRPGRYELQHFAQKIRGFRILDAQGQPVAFRKVTKDRWQVGPSAAGDLVVSYEFHARQMDAGGSWLDETQLYMNPVNCMLAVVGREDQPCELQLHLPAGWLLAGGLPQKSPGTLLAGNYEQLVDSPFICSPTLRHETYYIQDIPFHIWIQGDCQPDWPRLKADFAAFTREQLDLFGDFPVADYHFLNQVLPYPHYHGVEHGNSTVITLGPAERLMTGLYKELLGISSHELFHTWNIKKIRPAEMMPYDYTQENYFRTGYVAEGVTTYYGDYLLARSGVFPAEAYFEELGTVLARHFSDYGHQHYSVADSSFDLWLDGYKPGIPDRKVSIYHKGALAALILDLEIRRATQNQQSLDTVLKRLWEEFGKTGKGYTEADYTRLAEETAGVSLQHYFSEVIFGTAPLEPYLEKALAYVGCTLVAKPSTNLYESAYGFKVLNKENRLLVNQLAPGSPAASGLSLEDELVAVNGRRIEGNMDVLMESAGPVNLTLFRNKMLRQVKLQADGQRYFTRYLIRKVANASPAAQDNFRHWLRQDF